MRISKVTISIASTVLSLIGPVTVFAASPTAVNLGTSGNFAILTESGITTTGVTSISGDIGVSPIAATAITGFGLVMDGSNTFSTSSLVMGKVYAPGYAEPTPTKMTKAVFDMQTAYADAAGRVPNIANLGAGNIGGLTLLAGLYKWSTGVTIPTDVTLSGDANDVWIFQIAQNLDISSGTKVILSGGAQAGNIFWQVAGQATLGTTSIFNGNILSKKAIVLDAGATLYGRALAQTAVTLDSNTVTKPTSTFSSPTLSSTPSPTTSQPPQSSGGQAGSPQLSPTSTAGATSPSPLSTPTKASSEMLNKSNEISAEHLAKTTRASAEQLAKTTHESAELLNKSNEISAELLARTTEASAQLLARTTEKSAEELSKGNEIFEKLITWLTIALLVVGLIQIVIAIIALF